MLSSLGKSTLSRVACPLGKHRSEPAQGPADMRFDGIHRGGSVAGADHIEELAMVAVPAVEIVVGECVAKQKEDHDLRPEPLPGAIQPLVMGSAKERIMEVDVELGDLLAGNLAARGRPEKHKNRIEW